jgi:hypothetical protein
VSLAPPPGPLNPAGPAQFDLLFHFTSRPGVPTPTPSLPDHIRLLQPPARLDNILWSEQLLGFPPFSSPPVSSPMVCFSESPLAHIQWLISQRGWPPWALVVSRQRIYDLGGGPVWHARTPQYKTLTDDQRAWAVRLETASTGRSDWMHEREWRLPVPPGQPWLDLSPSSAMAAAVLIADATWQPSWRMAHFDVGRFISGETGQEVGPDDPHAQPWFEQRMALPRIWPGLLKLYWDARAGAIVPLTN